MTLTPREDTEERTAAWRSLTGRCRRERVDHNPDTWHMRDGRTVAVREVVDEIARCRDFVRTAGGGVTFPLTDTPVPAAGLVDRLCARFRATACAPAEPRPWAAGSPPDHGRTQQR